MTTQTAQLLNVKTASVNITIDGKEYTLPCTIRNESNPLSSGALGINASGKIMLPDGAFMVGLNVTLVGSQDEARAELAKQLKAGKAVEKSETSQLISGLKAAGLTTKDLMTFIAKQGKK